MNNKLSAFLLSLLWVSILAAPADPIAKDEAKKDPSGQKPPATPALPALKLPGIEINVAEHCVDVESTISLVDGFLELIACTKDSREHESIVVVNARPVHIHTALLLLGAKNGNPAMRQMRKTDDEQVRWIDFPPKGDPVDVYLVWKDAAGKTIERAISDFVSHSDQEGDGTEPDKKEAAAQKLPKTFLFAGSLLGDESKKPRDYLAESSGNVISIATFGDEVLCLPEIHSQENQQLSWKVDPTHLPELGAKVTLRLRVKKPSK